MVLLDQELKAKSLLDLFLENKVFATADYILTWDPIKISNRNMHSEKKLKMEFPNTNKHYFIVQSAYS